MTHYDVIIIGTGAGGGTLAYHLAPSGKKILLLERGQPAIRGTGHRSQHPFASRSHTAGTVQAGVMFEDRALELLQRPARLQAQLLPQQLTRLPVGRQMAIGHDEPGPNATDPQ